MSRGHETPPHRRRAWRRPSRSAPPVVVSSVVALALVAPALVPAPAAGAVTTTDEPGDGSPTARLVVAALDAVVGPTVLPEGIPADELALLPDGDVSMRLLVENVSDTTLDAARVVVELQTSVSDRPTLRARLGGESDGGSTDVLLDEALAPIEPRGIAQLSLVLPGNGELFAPRTTSGELLRVRPLEVSIVRGSTALDEVRTAVVGVSGLEAAPLETAVVLPIASEPTPLPPAAFEVDDEIVEQPTEDATPADEPPLPPDEALLPGGRVDRLTAAAEAAPADHVAIAPAAHTVEALVDASDSGPEVTDLLERLRALATADDAEVLSMPYAMARVGVLASDERSRPIANAAVTDGRRRLERAVGAAVTGSHLTVAPQTSTSLDLVPGDLLVSRWDGAAGVDLDSDTAATIPPAVRTAVAPAGRTLRVLVGDPWIERELTDATGDNGVALDAHRVVLETAAAWLEAPASDGRPIAVVPPVAWEPPGLLASEVVSRLDKAPWLRLASPRTVVQRTRTPTTGWAPRPSPIDELTAVVGDLADVASRFDSLAGAVPDEVEPPVFDHRDELYRAATAWPTSTPVGRARSIIATVSAALDDVTGVITVPDDTTVTLASERGVVPVTVRREAGPPLDVVVDVRPQGRLVVEGDTARSITLEQDGTATVAFDLRALGTGTFPLAVQVRSPDGRIVFADALISVRATAVSTPALGAIALVVVLLLVLGRRRRDEDRPRPRLEVVR